MTSDAETQTWLLGWQIVPLTQEPLVPLPQAAPRGKTAAQVPQDQFPEQEREAHSLLELQGAPASPTPPGRQLVASPLRTSVHGACRMTSEHAATTSAVRWLRGPK
jgi:hypothetical protein